MKALKFIFIVFLIPLLAFTAHKNYLSLTQIDYSKDTKAIQITMNVFIDDVELALNKTYNKAFELGTEKELKESDVYFDEYIKNQFKLKVNNEAITYTFLGKEYEGDLVYFYIEAENINDIKTIHIQNSMLMEFLPEQQNYIKLKINGEYDSLILTKNNDKGLLKF